MDKMMKMAKRVLALTLVLTLLLGSVGGYAPGWFSALATSENPEGTGDTYALNPENQDPAEDLIHTADKPEETAEGTEETAEGSEEAVEGEATEGEATAGEEATEGEAVEETTEGEEATEDGSTTEEGTVEE